VRLKTVSCRCRNTDSTIWNDCEIVLIMILAHLKAY